MERQMQEVGIGNTMDYLRMDGKQYGSKVRNKALGIPWIIYEWMGNSTRQRFEIRPWKILID